MKQTIAIAVLSAAQLLLGCGDGGTEPTPTTPDPPRATVATVTPATARLTALGVTVQFSVEVRDQNGNVMAGAGVTWSSSNASVATVHESGLVTAVANGTATITAAAGGVSGAATVTVVQEVSAVTVTPAADTLVVGDTLRLAAEAADANGHVVAGMEFTWSSGDTLVAVVNGSGLVTGVAEGDVTVTANSSEVRGGAELTVAAPVPTTVAVTPDTVVFTAIGQRTQLAAEVRDQAGRPMEDVAVSWSSADTMVVVVDSAGRVMALGSGTTTVTAMAGEATGVAFVTVMQAAGSVIVSPAADTVTLGDTLRLVAEALDANGHRVEGVEFTWSSSNGSLAAVDASGLVRGVAEGTATITATSGSVSGTSDITVENPDRAALVALYNATNGPNWVNNENWLSDAPLGQWYGVDTDREGRVVRIQLGGTWNAEDQRYIPHGLSGPIPPELGNLHYLTGLYLYQNDLSGKIPPELGNIASLTDLSLGGNNLTGPIPPELGHLANLSQLWLSSNDFTGPIPAELGNLTRLASLGLGSNNLTGPIPPELGRLASLDYLYLAANDLTGPIPAELGNLVKLESLSLGRNDLTGPIPHSFLQLRRLDEVYVGGNDSLCFPGVSAFTAWRQGIEDHDLTRVAACNASDQAVLESLHEATGGDNWTESTNWLSDHAVDQWYGTTTDSLGRVTELDLASNGLVGGVPAILGDLAEMSVLRIGHNALSGRLPQSLVQLSLREFHYADTELCAPDDASFQAWLRAMPSHEGTGVECEPLSDREILEAVYHATDGPNWINADNWLTDAPLREWFGVRVDHEGLVFALDLHNNDLNGPIPPELGHLASLRVLTLAGNDLTGPIPPELGHLTDLTWLALSFNDLVGEIPRELSNLASLEYLSLCGNHLNGPILSELGNLARLTQLALCRNDLSGPIPPELGNLTSLTELYLWGNELTGEIPRQLGNLTRLTVLQLSGSELSRGVPKELGQLTELTDLSLGNNKLEGPIPSELGNLARLTRLGLAYNDLTGPIPRELGNLSALEALTLGFNDLSGPIPPELGGMSSLRELGLTNNGKMAGALPTEITVLQRLEKLLAGGTSLCVPLDGAFPAWLARVHKRRIAPCAEGDPPAAYLTQAAQSWDYPVPLVAGERALLRVFPTANQATSEGIPAVRARFFAGGRETLVLDIPGTSAPIPTEVDESSLHKSANAEIPGNIVQPGLEMAIEIDPEGTLDEGLGVAKRIPESGRLAMDVRAMPTLDLTLIPFVWTETHDSSIVDLIEAMAADPENHEMLGDTRTLLPVGDLEVTAHEPVLSSSNSAFRLLDQTKAIRAMEGGMGYYKGMMSRPVTDAGGIAELPGRSSFSTPRGSTLAHELGHNMNLQHAPCGGADGPDPSYPYPDGSIGTWGYDFDDGGLVPPSRPDLMSYCFQQRWIGDYGFTNALRYRLSDEGSLSVASGAASNRSLLLWGGIGADTVPYLEPAFVVEAPPTLPDSTGDYRVVGHSADGGRLFSLSFAMSVTADGDGSSSFVFVLPVRPRWQDGLASITLAGPGGSVTLNGESKQPMAILRNPRTGQVRGFLRGLLAATQATRDAAVSSADPALEMLFSRGIPGAEAWRR